MPKKKNKTKSSNVLKFLFTETLNLVKFSYFRTCASRSFKLISNLNFTCYFRFVAKQGSHQKHLLEL